MIKKKVEELKNDIKNVGTDSMSDFEILISSNQHSCVDSANFLLYDTFCRMKKECIKWEQNNLKQSQKDFQI